MLKKFFRWLGILVLSFKGKIVKKIYFAMKINYILNVLEGNNVHGVSKFNEKNWHHGYCYFSGFYKDKKVFIKVDTNLKMLKNEVSFYNVTKSKLQQYLVPVEMFYEDSELQFVMYEFLTDHLPLTLEKLSQHPNLIEDIYNIVKTLKDTHIVHRDMKLSNFLIKNSELKIIDFTFSISLTSNDLFKELDPSIKRHYSILESLGAKVFLDNFSWNDSLSIVKILESTVFGGKGDIYARYTKQFLDLSLDTTYSLNVK
jgi:serine/threonine protein kinase